MSVSIDKFVPSVLREAHKCPQLLAKDAIIRAIREFCRETHIYRKTLDPMPLIKSVSGYTIDQPTDLRVLSIISMRNAAGTKIIAKAEDDLDDFYDNWRIREGQYPENFVQEDPLTFRIVPVPTLTQVKGLQDIRAAVMPELDVTKVDDLFIDEYDEVIKSGALKRVLAMTGREWFNPQMSKHHGDAFDKGINIAKMEVFRGHSSARRRVRKNKLKGAP